MFESLRGVAGRGGQSRICEMRDANSYSYKLHSCYMLTLSECYVDRVQHLHVHLRLWEMSVYWTAIAIRGLTISISMAKSQLVGRAKRLPFPPGVCSKADQSV